MTIWILRKHGHTYWGPLEAFTVQGTFATKKEALDALKKKKATPNVKNLYSIGRITLKEKP